MPVWTYDPKEQEQQSKMTLRHSVLAGKKNHKRFASSVDFSVKLNVLYLFPHDEFCCFLFLPSIIRL